MIMCRRVEKPLERHDFMYMHAVSLDTRLTQGLTQGLTQLTQGLTRRVGGGYIK
jgi:hypothetical protein